MNERRRCDESGGALAFAMIAMVVVLAVAASAMYVSLGGQRTAIRSYRSKKAFFCAEMALERGRTLIVSNWVARDNILAGNNPLWFNSTLCSSPNGAEGACPGPGQLTYLITVEDDMPNSTTDANNRIFVHATVYNNACSGLAKVSALLGSKSKLIGGY